MGIRFQDHGSGVTHRYMAIILMRHVPLHMDHIQDSVALGSSTRFPNNYVSYIP